jgi:hypothetical protein
MIPPMIMPPAVPIIKIGANAFVIIAGGKLSNAPKRRPVTHPGHPGKSTQPITSPIASRSMNAASNAVFLSGNDIGSIIATESAPKTTPLIKPDIKFDIAQLNRVRLFAAT